MYRIITLSDETNINDFLNEHKTLELVNVIKYEYNNGHPYYMFCVKDKLNYDRVEELKNDISNLECNLMYEDDIDNYSHTQSMIIDYQNEIIKLLEGE